MADGQESDWRLVGQEKFMTRARLAWRAYVSPRRDWDHDHCEFCGMKFMEPPQPGTLQEGYFMAEGKRWVCLQCCLDFKARFGWTTSGGKADA